MNSIENFKIRLNNAEERIIDLEAKTIEIIQSEEQKEKRMEKSETNRPGWEMNRIFIKRF